MYVIYKHISKCELSVCYNIVGYLSLYIDGIDVLSSLARKTQKDVENTIQKRENSTMLLSVF